LIHREEMFEPLLAVAKGFLPRWNKFIKEWKDEPKLPQYLALSDLARYIADLVRSESVEELKQIFDVIERWHLEGDSYVKEAATIGLLECLQNTNVVGHGIQEKIETYLLPESKTWWRKVGEFWDRG
jgi:hypothetical protein